MFWDFICSRLWVLVFWLFRKPYFDETLLLWGNVWSFALKKWLSCRANICPFYFYYKFRQIPTSGIQISSEFLVIFAVNLPTVTQSIGHKLGWFIATCKKWRLCQIQNVLIHLNIQIGTHFLRPPQTSCF